VQAADASGAMLAVGMPRRFLHAGRFVRWAVENRVLGDITSFDIRDGGKFNWPLATDFFFRKDVAGGGVLIDTGVHTLDQLLWWLGDIQDFEYYDDNAGGVESECELRLTLKSGARGVIELTRTRAVRGTAIVRGERGELEIGLNWNTVSLRFADAPWRLAGLGVPLPGVESAEQSQIDLIVAEHDDFFAAIRGDHAPEVDGRQGRRTSAWIEACYRARRPLALPWMLG
jgi:predicted dehydrogenase